ncbi:MAG: Enoyl-CoA hydratase/isomerase, partial [Myxococcaceae bacterium]|nr:Enoyl-CoA hydratase/isomerase [Myxococcaceae bacterium]
MPVVNATIRPDGVGHLELNRPEVRNAINVEMIQALHAQLEAWAVED